ncbi:MAG TPA: hypothetical protein VNU26_02905 [Mycobacteriales bacterium]|nr:hypothetical protein [Mycobacteriales bacterium]
MRSSVARRIRPVADAQLGLITSAQLRELGVDLALPRREGWLRLADGLWCTTAEPDDEQLLVGLELYAPHAMASGALACRWHGVRHAPSDPGCRALVPHGTTLLGGPLLDLRQTRRMPDGVEHRQRTVAPPDRAVADAARWTPWLQDARAVVLAALADRRVERQSLVDELHAGQRRGSARLRRALDDWDRGARSAPEAEAADALLAVPGTRPAPPFYLNPELWLDGVLLGSPDGYVPGAWLGWEVDSEEHHGDDDDLDATLQRHQRFADAGFELLHVTPKRMRAAPSAWALDVVARAARRRGRRAPSGLVVVEKGPLLSAGTLAA